MRSDIYFKRALIYESLCLTIAIYDDRFFVIIAIFIMKKEAGASTLNELVFLPEGIKTIILSQKRTA